MQGTEPQRSRHHSLSAPYLPVPLSVSDASFTSRAKPVLPVTTFGATACTNTGLPTTLAPGVGQGQGSNLRRSTAQQGICQAAGYQGDGHGTSPTRFACIYAFLYTKAAAAAVAAAAAALVKHWQYLRSVQTTHVAVCGERPNAGAARAF